MKVYTPWRRSETNSWCHAALARFYKLPQGSGAWRVKQVYWRHCGEQEDGVRIDLGDGGVVDVGEPDECRGPQKLTLDQSEAMDEIVKTLCRMLVFDGIWSE